MTQAYDALAPLYDELTSGHRYEEWTRDLEGLAREHGLCGRRLLDVGCGTGKSFIPFLARGYAVTACDISSGMLHQARAKRATTGAALHLADMRRLPDLGSFDLVTCLDDALNHLLTEADLRAAFGEAGRLLAPGGVYLFDLNSLRTYRSVFSGRSVVPTADGRFELRGDAAPDSGPGGLCRVVIEGSAPDATGHRRRSTSCQVQRHHPYEAVRRLLEEEGLTCEAVRGQRDDGGIDRWFDELTHTKAIYVARRPNP